MDLHSIYVSEIPVLIAASYFPAVQPPSIIWTSL